MSILPDPPDYVAPGQPVDALWGNDVVAWVRQAMTIVQTLTPIGALTMYGGPLEPPGWLFCHGQTVSTTTYSALYAVIGDRFNQPFAGLPAGQFRLPNMQGRYGIGVNSPPGTYMSSGIGERYGSPDAILPPHSHGAHLLTSTNGQHWHQPSTANQMDVGLGQSYFVTTGPEGGGDDLHLNQGWVGQANISNPIGDRYELLGGTGNAGQHQHTADGQTDGAGAGDAGNANLPPSVSFNFIIRFG